MNAKISIGISEDGKTDVLVVRKDRFEFLPITKKTITRSRAHIEITDASFSRLARLLVRRARQTHSSINLIHYTMK
jgi:hypothetical protein